MKTSSMVNQLLCYIYHTEVKLILHCVNGVIAALFGTMLFSFRRYAVTRKHYKTADDNYSEIFDTRKLHIPRAKLRHNSQPDSSTNTDDDVNNWRQSYANEAYLQRYLRVRIHNYMLQNNFIVNIYQTFIKSKDIINKNVNEES